MYLESRVKKLRLRRRLRNLFWLLALVALVASGIYFQEQLLAFYKEVRRVINQPDVGEVLKEQRREEFGIFCIGPEQATDCYFFDKEGIIFKGAKTIVGEIILRVDEISDYQPSLGQKFLPQEQWDSLVKILDFLLTKKWPASTFRLKRDQRELILEGPPKLLFSLRFDPSQHLTALTELKKKVKLENLSYIDLRVEDKIFYK